MILRRSDDAAIVGYEIKKEPQPVRFFFDMADDRYNIEVVVEIIQYQW